VTVLHDGRLHLRIDPRPDGTPWLADVTALARALADAQQRLAAYEGEQRFELVDLDDDFCKPWRDADPRFPIRCAAAGWRRSARRSSSGPARTRRRGRSTTIGGRDHVDTFTDESHSPAIAGFPPTVRLEPGVQSGRQLGSGDTPSVRIPTSPTLHARGAGGSGGVGGRLDLTRELEGHH